MTFVQRFTFNAFEENTYVVYDDSKECVIIDPGCDSAEEEQALYSFIESQQLKPLRLLNTHCHIDHILGNAFVASTWGLKLEFHEKEQRVIDEAPNLASFFGVRCKAQPEVGRYITSGEEIVFGKTTLGVLFTPGHSPGSVSFYCYEAGFVVSGDVLFKDSIGRYDLPGANGDVLMQSIMSQLVTLPAHTKIYSGHGPETTIGREIIHNPYLSPRG